MGGMHTRGAFFRGCEGGPDGERGAGFDRSGGPPRRGGGRRGLAERGGGDGGAIGGGRDSRRVSPPGPVGASPSSGLRRKGRELKLPGGGPTGVPFPPEDGRVNFFKVDAFGVIEAKVPQGQGQPQVTPVRAFDEG